jgi:uncharacterized protein (TIGR02246 family)
MQNFQTIHTITRIPSDHLSGDLKSDEYIIRQIAAMIQLAWNTGDPDTMVHDLASEAEFITISGKLLKGREEILNHFGATLNSDHYHEVMLKLGGTGVSFLNETTAFCVASIQFNATQPDFPLADLPSYLVLVLTKQDQHWQITQGRHRFRLSSE